MAQDTTLTITGNLTADPELTFTPRGDAVMNFTVASTPRYFDRATNEWRDGDPLFLRCSVWRQAAENAAESLTRGSRVSVSGRLKQRTFTTREGDTRTVIELEVDELAASLRYATAKITRNAPAYSSNTGSRQRTTPNSNGFGRPGTTDTEPATEATTAHNDPWTEPALAGAGAAGFAGSGADPGF
ncbi:single-stranded DNA-binding protein [Nocardia sp. CA2R105]|uniref:single-stranded DNA-binding protein n=1 Tax=Nocardia coffeae TaxID=2873381 RepID=UPI001CA7A942|nr:single-stranded DNA-binding protein [Nocardia coffeae]MBY8864039.1 single-stranded DNA-binding protein [Nocardia coffeae]